MVRIKEQSIKFLSFDVEVRGELMRRKMER